MHLFSSILCARTCRPSVQAFIQSSVAQSSNLPSSIFRRWRVNIVRLDSGSVRDQGRGMKNQPFAHFQAAHDFDFEWRAVTDRDVPRSGDLLLDHEDAPVLPVAEESARRRLYHAFALPDD